ncbi:hypothetical protein OIO90_003795 [Microbotryomycetes sp. JL221]|nr:hypothetical protein OIO90_003795 [Microbotryomycetes sp. JL221]
MSLPTTHDSSTTASNGQDNTNPSNGTGFEFTTYFKETEHSVPFNQRPTPSFPAQRVERKRQDDPIQLDSTSRPLWQRLPAWVPIVCWIATSSFVILQNKYILSDLGFRHPVALTTIHLAFQTVATRMLRRYTPMVDKAKELEATNKMNRDTFVKKIVPVGLLFSASLVLSNWVYLRLTVSFIQMIKAFTPVSVLLVSAAFGLKTLNQKILSIVGVICFGVAIASYGEIQFELWGFLIQVLAIGIESCRLVLVQILLQGFGLDPMASLYYTAPVCLVVNAMLLLPVEGTAVFYNAIHQVGLPTLFGNACMTFALNLSSVWLIGKASGLVLTLAGVLKDILIISGSYFILGTEVTRIQVFGYIIALAGLIAFKMQ